MIRKNPRGDLPVVHESAFGDPTAILCGRVVVNENVFIGPYAVIRADEVDANGHLEPIIIGAHSNIQEWCCHPFQIGRGDHDRRANLDCAPRYCARPLHGGLRCFCRI